jgi:hypothetical protein
MALEAINVFAFYHTTGASVGNGGVGLVIVSIDLAPFGGLDFLPVDFLPLDFLLCFRLWSFCPFFLWRWMIWTVSPLVDQIPNSAAIIQDL